MSTNKDNRVGIFSGLRVNTIEPMMGLIVGSPGAGKTVINLKILMEYSKKGHNCLMLSPEISEKTITNRLKRGFGVYKSKPNGKIVVKYVGPAVPYNIAHVKKTIKERGIKLLIIDSIQVLNYHYDEFFFSEKHQPRALLLEKRKRTKKTQIMDLTINERAQRSAEVFRHLADEFDCHVIITMNSMRNNNDGYSIFDGANMRFVLNSDIIITCGREEYTKHKIVARVQKNRWGADGNDCKYELPIF